MTFLSWQQQVQVQAKARVLLSERAALEERIRAKTRLIDLDLLDFIPAVTPMLHGDVVEPPQHFAEFASVFDRIDRGEAVRVLFSGPPQMGKSTIIEHGIARALARRPHLPIVYASYGDDVATAKSREMRDIARRIGLEFRDDADRVDDWLTPQGGGLRARSIGGPLTGQPAKILIVDDIHKGRKDAESALARQNVFDWFTSVADTRVHPDSSIIISSTRWHDDDLIGRLAERKKPDGTPRWEYLLYSAIKDDGSPLWHRRPLEFLRQKQENEYDWWSLWMGKPRTRGDRVFKGVSYYDKLPARYRIGKGVDLAYTEAKRACWSVGIVLVESDGDVYVVDVRRKQCEVTEFRHDLEQADASWPGAWHWFIGSSEKGTAQLLPELGIAMEGVRASSDKLDRAQAVAAAWNAGRVFVPRSAPWLKEFVDEVGGFTGIKGETNDQVDALASAFEGVRYRADPPRTVKGAGTAYEHPDGGRSFW